MLSSYLFPLSVIASTAFASLLPPASSTVASISSFDSSTSAFPSSIDLLEIGIPDLAAYLANGTITSVSLVQAYLANIEANNHAGLLLRAVIETGPVDSLLAIASSLDEERANGTIRGPLHGIPILLKDNIATVGGY